MHQVFLLATLVVSTITFAQSTPAKRPPLKFKIASPSCPLEYKPMANAKAPWKSYAKQLKAGTTVQGFAKGKEDLFTFRSANPKNFYFRGSLACLRGEKATNTVPKATPKIKNTSDSGDMIVGLSYWGSEQTVVSTDASFSSEQVVTRNIAANVGYSKEFRRVGASSLGVQATVSVGYSLLRNKDKTPVTPFKGTGVVGALQLRPYYYYQISGIGVGPLVALAAHYSVYGTNKDGKLRKPLQFVALTGLSLKISSAGHTVDLGLANLQPSRLYASVNFAF